MSFLEEVPAGSCQLSWNMVNDNVLLDSNCRGGVWEKMLHLAFISPLCAFYWGYGCKKESVFVRHYGTIKPRFNNWQQTINSAIYPMTYCVFMKNWTDVSDLSVHINNCWKCNISVDDQFSNILVPALLFSWEELGCTQMFCHHVFSQNVGSPCAFCYDWLFKL